MSKYYKYLGLVAFTWAFSIITYCVINTPGFNITQRVISELGADPKFSTLYNFSILVSGILLFIFVNYLAKVYKWTLVTRSLFCLAAFGLVLIAFFPIKYPLVLDLQRYFHWSGAGIFFICMSFGVISSNLHKHNLSAYLQIFWGILSLLLPVSAFLFTSYRGMGELINTLMNSIWLLSLSFVIIASRKVT